MIGGSIGYAIYYNVFFNKLSAKLPSLVEEYAVQAGLPTASATTFVFAYLTDPSSLTHIPGVTPAILEAAAMGSRWAYSDSLSYVWYTSIAFGGCAIVACVFLGDIGKYMTNRIAAKVLH